MLELRNFLLKMKTLDKAFYNRSAEVVATKLLGKILTRSLDNSIISGRIVEVEAYLPFIDEAAHSFKGKTKRNLSLFKSAGHAYIHSIHTQNCLDVVTDKLEIPGSVLIRAIEPLDGIEKMKEFRNKENLLDLTSGPGKLTKALNITKELNGIDLTNSKELWILDDGFIVKDIVSGARIGISKARHKQLRFYIKGNDFVSR